MTIWAEVEGRLAILDSPTVDKRVLETMDPPTIHFQGLPVPIILQSEKRSDVIGRVNRVRIERRQDRMGSDLLGFGEIDLLELAKLRPELVPPDGFGSPWPLLRAEISVHHPGRAKIRYEKASTVFAGAWEIRAVTIPREDRDPCWPGVGLRITEIAAEAVRG